MLGSEILRKVTFCILADRIGPDMLFTHWMLHFKSTMIRLCRKKFAKFGYNADFRPGAYAVSCSHIKIGKRVVVRPNTMLFADDFADIVIGDDVLMGAGIHMYVNNHKFENIDIPLSMQGYYPSKGILIKEGAWIGANSILLPGVTIGKNSVVGAGSIVTKSVPDFTVVVGNPAKAIRVIGSK